MAWDEYYAIRHSDLYENKGCAKSLLALIGMLIIGPPDEGEEPDPQQGYCVATQRYLACEIGCSDSAAQQLIKMFIKDSWLKSHPYRDKLGRQRNTYSIPSAVIEKIKARERKKDDNGEYIRAKNPNMRRADNGKRFSQKPTGNLMGGIDDDDFDGNAPTTQSHGWPTGNPMAGLRAICGVANGQSARCSKSFREVTQTVFEKAPVPEASLSGCSTETKDQNQNQSANADKPVKPRTPYHSHKFNSGNSQCTECEFVCEHPLETVGTIKGQLAAVCKHCRVVLEDVPA